MSLRLSVVLEGNVRNEIGLNGVEKGGTISYGIDGIVAGHNGVLHYFRACADEGKSTVVYAMDGPADALNISRLLSSTGRTISQVNLLAKRLGPRIAPLAGAIYANLELNQVRVNLRPVIGDSGRRWYLIEFVSGLATGKLTSFS